MSKMRLMAVGDIWLRTQNNRDPFERIKPEFESKDVLFGNLETALSLKGKMVKKRWILNSPLESAEFLKETGFDILSIANNHTLDLGSEGFINTVNVLNEHEIQYVGGDIHAPSEPTIIERNGIKLGFLAYTEGYFSVPQGISFNKLRKNNILRDIKELRNKCDFIVVSLHWGVEHVYYPSHYQIQLAHTLIDHGATVVLGTGPHAVQGIEHYKNGLVAYSMGNFQFDPTPPHQKDNMTLILCVDFDHQGIMDYQTTPCLIDENYLPFPAEGRDEEMILEHIAKTSDIVSSGKITKNWWYEQIAEEFLSENMNSFRNRIREHGIVPLAECAVWSVTPFCMNCYAAIIRKRWKQLARGQGK